MFFSNTVKARRAALQTQFDVRREFETYEESCVPSYVHPFLPAAWVAWRRPIAAAKLYDSLAPDGPILDFGSATGEVRFLMRKARGPYHFVEQTDVLAAALVRESPDATREYSGALGENRFAAVFALDSLEHNELEELDPLLEQLARSMRPDGVFILSGPTENALYKFGRKLAGFEGHYHHMTIHDIERVVANRFRKVGARMEPAALAPLFSITAWKVK
ncbi:MAG: methyltransferase domain-containing protein [Pseudomonadota bacterium]